MTPNGPPDDSPSDESGASDPATDRSPGEDPRGESPVDDSPDQEPVTSDPAADESPEGSAADEPAEASGEGAVATGPSGTDSLAYLGYAAVAVGFGGVLAAVFLAPPWFSVFTGALSVLGFERLAVAPLFNGSLVVGGALGAGFVAYLWATAEQPFHLAAVPFLLLATICMSLVGVFPIFEGPHFFVSAAFFVFLTLGVLLWGLGDYAAGRAGRAAALILLPLVHVTTWVWWVALPWFPPGIAIPELAGVVALVVWAMWVSTDRLGLTGASASSQGAP